jgi:hypothetical protein
MKMKGVPAPVRWATNASLSRACRRRGGRPRRRSSGAPTSSSRAPLPRATSEPLEIPTVVAPMEVPASGSEGRRMADGLSSSATVAARHRGALRWRGVGVTASSRRSGAVGSSGTGKLLTTYFHYFLNKKMV